MESLFIQLSDYVKCQNMTGFVVEGHIYHPLIYVLKTVVANNSTEVTPTWLTRAFPQPVALAVIIAIRLISQVWYYFCVTLVKTKNTDAFSTYYTCFRKPYTDMIMSEMQNLQF